MPSNPPDADTLPGLHGTQDVMALRRENGRLRRERDELAAELDRTSLPPPTPGQKRGRMALNFGKWAVVLPVAAVAARALVKKYPELTDLVDAVLSLVGL